jgi:glycine/D-amino acid oxidase-like deaminating enzyme
MKPGWFSGLGKAVYEPSLALLDRLYGVQDLLFDVHVGNAGKIAQQTVHWVNPAKILAGPTEFSQVDAVGPGWVDVWLNTQAPTRLKARNIIVAAGIWTEHLLPQFRQKAQRGMALLYPSHHPERGVIKPWAPYRQLVAFDRGDGLWVGDGSAIKVSNWSPQREEEVAAREVKLARRVSDVGPTDEVHRLHGIRPYWGEKPCLLEEVSPGLWVASGGAKNGTIAAGWCAHEIARRIA